MAEGVRVLNLGARTRHLATALRFPDAGTAVVVSSGTRSSNGVEVPLVNPPPPDDGIWI